MCETNSSLSFCSLFPMAGHFLLLGHRRVLDPKGWRGTDCWAGRGPFWRQKSHYLEGRCFGGKIFQFSSVVQSCPILCDPMSHSMPVLPVHHQLPEFTQTHIHRVSDAIQQSHPLSSPSPPAQSFPTSESFPMSQLFA